MRKLVEWRQATAIDCVAACMASIYLTVKPTDYKFGEVTHNLCVQATGSYRHGVSIVHTAWSYFGLDCRALAVADEPSQPQKGYMYILFTSNGLGALHAVVLDARHDDEKQWVLFDPAGGEWVWHPRNMNDYEMESSGKVLPWYIPVLQVKGVL